MKEAKTNVEKINPKKGFYHYQKNQNKEVKTILDKKFETRTRNPGILGLKPANTMMEGYNTSNRKINGNGFKKKPIKKQNSNNSRKMKTIGNLNEKNNNSSIYEDDMLEAKMKKGRNKINKDKVQNNTIAYNHDINLPKNENDESRRTANNKKNIVLKIKKDKINKKSNKRVNGDKESKLVQNIMDDFDQTMEEYTSLYNTHNATSRGKTGKNYSDKSHNNKSSSKSKLRSSVTNHKSHKNKENTSNDSNPINNSLIIDNESNTLNQNNIKEEKNKNKTNETKKAKNKINKENTKKSKHKKNKKSEKDISEFELGNSDHASGTIIKIKKNKGNTKYNLKEEELPLYKGEIDYNYVSIKNIEESIDDLMARYKKMGYTCTKKGKNLFKFIKGPNIHHVELMRLGNGLLYFNVTK